MATTTLPKSQIIVTLESGAMIEEIKKALKMIRGIASVRTVRTSEKNQITPALRKKILKAEEEHEKGETIACESPEEMIRYFDSL